MSTQNDFDPEALHRLIDEALGDNTSAVSLEPRQSNNLPFAFNDTHLLELLATILPTYMHDADIQQVFSTLRENLYEGMYAGDLRQLHTVIKYCKKCPDVGRDPTMPVWNLTNPDMVLVSENVNRYSDDFLLETLKDAGFSSKYTALTYLTRCPIKGRSPSDQEVTNCSSYLFAELQLMQPRLIVTIGNLVSAQFIGAVKVTEDHGKIFWIGPWAIMPVLSPGYAVKADLRERFQQDFINAHKFIYGD